MKIKVFILFMLSLLFVSCMKKERILVCEEDFLNNKIYMKIKNEEEIRIIISNSDLNFLFSGFENLTERKDSAYIELSAKYSSKDNEIIIHNSKIRLPVLFYNEMSCTILSEKGAVVDFNEKLETNLVLKTIE